MYKPEIALTTAERRSIMTLTGIYACRLLGLFMVLPVLALYIQAMPSSHGMLIGLALGIYGIFQALLQLPFGMLSDRYGRRPLILWGLIIFIVGSLICAFTDQIGWFLIGRSLQGAGAVGSTINAFAADLIRPAQRSKAMAIIGIGVGGSFLLAMVLGPILNWLIGVPGLFVISALLGFLGIFLLQKGVPEPPYHEITKPNWPTLKAILIDPDCLRLNGSIFLLHAILAISFIIIPLLLQALHLEAKQVGLVYIPTLILAFGIALPLLGYAERRTTMKVFLFIAIAIFGLSQLGLALFPLTLIGTGLLLLCFFTAFIFLEATLPALITRIAPTQSRGTASGVFSTAQFSGIFVGGLIGGILYEHISIQFVMQLTALASFIWILMIRRLQIPTVHSPKQEI